MNYENLSAITVKTQEELDQIPQGFKGRIYIKFGTRLNPAVVLNKYYLSVVALGNSNVVALGNSNVEAWDNSNVVVWGNSNVVARGNSSVVAYDNSNVVARDNSNVEAHGNSNVKAWDNSSVAARDNSNVEAWNNSSVVAYDNSNVVALGNSNVEAWDNSNVVVWGNSNVRAYGNSNVVAYDNSNVRAHDNSNVVARDNSNVVAYDNSNVVAYGNTQILNYLKAGKIQTFGNARVVNNPNNIEDFMTFYNIKHNETTAIFYKAVRKRDGVYYSDYCKSFTYTLGEIAISDCNTDIDENYDYGIHISHMSWALNYGSDWGDLAILEVETKIADIVCPRHTDGKVRTSKVKVLREVPLEECGLYGKIIAKRRES